MDLTVTKNRSK